MALVVKDRVKVYSSTTGTGTLSLGSAFAGFQTFNNALGDGDTTYYGIFESSTGNWEVGLGTYTSSGNTLSRDTILESSNAGAAVNLTADTEVFITYPAEKSVYFDASGDLILNQDPTSNLQAATKQYVDTIAAAGLHYHAPVRVQTTANLTATYNNGSSGVGATLTNSGTQAAISIDNVTLSSADRVLVSEQTNAAHNGVYTVTNVGSASTNWVLTRATDADSYGPSDPDSLGEGDAFFIKEGDTNAGHLDVMTTSGEIVFGTTNIVFSEVAETTVYSAGTGLSLSGTEFNVGAGTGITVDATSVSTVQDIATSATPTFDGLTTTGDITFGDNDKAIFGAGSDLQIYSDGANSIIQESDGTGNLLIRASNINLQNSGATATLAQFIDGGKSSLRYNGSEKLATTSTGIDVTGTVTADGLTVDTNTLYVDSSNNRVGVGTTAPSQKVEISDTSTADVALRMTNNDGNLEIQKYQDDLAIKLNDTGDIIIRSGSPSLLQHMRIASNGDISFYEDTGTTAKFFWDASTMELAIGTDTPVNPLTIQQTSINWPYIALTNTSGTIKSQFGYQVGDDLLDIAANSGGIKFRTNNTETMRLSSSGVLSVGNTSPKTWNSNSTGVIQFGGVGALENFNATDDPVILSANQYRASDGNFKYIETNEASRISLYAGDVNFQTAPSGTADTNATFATRLTIKNTGNVGIGTSSPVQELHVSGGSATRVDIQVTTDATGHTAGDGAQLGYIDGYGSYLWNFENSDTYFAANNARSLTLDSGGWALFERSGKSLYVNANYGGNNIFAQISPPNTDGMDLSLAAQDTREEDIYIKNSTGYVGIGESNPDTQLHVQGVITAGSGQSTAGTSVLEANYVDHTDDNPNVLGTQYSNSAWDIGYGVRPKSGAAGYVSSVDNGSWPRGVLEIKDDLSFKRASAQTTAVGSDVSLTEVFKIASDGDLVLNPLDTTAQAYFGSTAQTGYMNLVIYSNSGSGQIWKSGTGYSGYGGASALNIYNSNANIAFFSNARTTADVNVSGGNVTVAGNIYMGDSTANSDLSIYSVSWPEVNFFKGTTEEARIGAADTDATYNTSQGDVYFYDPTGNVMRYIFPIDGTGSITRNNGAITVWDSSNDGSGSGLDADTVDGLQASSFLRSDAVDYASNIIVFEDGMRVGTGSGHGTAGRATISFGEGDPTTDTYFIEYDGDNLSGDANALIFRNNNIGEQLRLEYGGAIKFTGRPTASGNIMFDQGNLIEGTSFSGTYPVLFGVDDTTGRVFENNNILYNGTTNVLTISGNTVWHGGNTSTVIDQTTDITNQDWNTYIDGTEASWARVANMTGSNRPPNYTYGTALSVSMSGSNKFQLYASHTGSAGDGLYFRTGWNTDYRGWAKIYDSVAHPALGYVDVSAGNYGTIRVDDDRSVSWAGYSIRDQWVFMSSGASACGIYNDTDNEWSIYCAQNAATYLYYNGSYTLETTSGGIAITGAITATSDITAYYSDERLKNFEGKIDGALDKVSQLSGYYFRENDKAKELGYENDARQVGVSAQEVEAVMPEVVKPAPVDPEYKTVQYEKLVPLLIEAIKELKEEVRQLKEDKA